LRQKVKTWPLLSIEVNSKYSKAKFKAGDDIKVSSSILSRYSGMEGIVLEVAYHSIDGWVYQVDIVIDNFSHIQYFGEQELDYTLQEKRDRRLKELGI
jgi:hypothetical protein